MKDMNMANNSRKNDLGKEDKMDTLRPQTLEDFKGQPDVTRELRIVLQAAKEREELCDHILLSGPPGLGKTTLAQIIANELSLTYVPVSGPAIEKPGDLASILSGLGDRSLLFIDEIHRLPRVAEEVLYTAMEDNRLDIVVGDGLKARAVSLRLNRFVLVGATTQAGLLSAPLRDRFGYAPRLRLYNEESLAGIVQRSSKILGIEIDRDGALAVSMRSRGTPRIANRLVRRVRDWAQIEKVEKIKAEHVVLAAEAFGIDDKGLDQTARDILRALCTTFSGAPVGLNTLAASVGEAPNTVEEVYEPYLMHLGMLARTPRGRIPTFGAYQHLGLRPIGVAIEAAVDQPQLEFEEE
jgi:Holliday junction DNA helicase RuvB